MIEIEFTKDTLIRTKGERARVDPASAVSLCDRKKVAKRVAPEPVVPAVEPDQG